MFYLFLGIMYYKWLPRWCSGKESAYAGDARHSVSILGLERFPGVGNGNQLQYCLPGKFHGQRSLAGCSPWDCKELDMTEHTHTHTHTQYYRFMVKN